MPEHLKRVTIYTDGACQPNPGRGGYAAILLWEAHTKEVTGGYRHTTNNRMELMAAIKGLEALKFRCRVDVFCDSRYVVNGIEKAMVRGKVNKKNGDLWVCLYHLCQAHIVTFHWLRGHNGDATNERCDLLAEQATCHAVPPEVDTGYALPSR